MIVEWTEQTLRDALDQDMARFGCVHISTSIQMPALPAAEASQSPDAIEQDDAKAPRTYSGTASFEEVSRTRYLIRIAGLDLSQYQRNPVVLAQHHPVVPATLEPAVIGRIASVSKVEGRTQLRFRGLEFDADSLSQAWERKVASGFVRMLSIGFVPHEVQYVEETVGRGKDAKVLRYLEFVRSELTEISVVAIGANRGAYFDPPKSRSRQNSEQVAQLLARITTLESQLAEMRQAETRLFDALGKLAASRDAVAVNRLLAAAEAVRS